MMYILIAVGIVSICSCILILARTVAMAIEQIGMCQMTLELIYSVLQYVRHTISDLNTKDTE